MHKQRKDLLRTLVPRLRHTLAGHQDDAGVWHRGDLDRELERLGFAPDGTITPIDALCNPTPEEVRAYRVAEVQLAPLPKKQRPPARAELIERAAYSWINRLLALRAMEARDLIDETLRQNPAYAGVSEALYILRHQDPARTTGADAGWWAVIDDACAGLGGALPGLFDPADPAVALRPSTSALLRCTALVGGDVNGFTLEQSDAATSTGLSTGFADPDAIGWAYQFYQEEAKGRTYAKLNSGGKAETRAEIAAVTQLFTEPYMVQWLLQNSLGRSYAEAYPDTQLPATWDYYIDRSKIDDLEDNVQRSTFKLSTLTVMDPCMGSGHFLREAFDMLVAMYREQHPQMDARQIADRILRDHLYGIDLDPRAAQLAALTLYLRAWELVRDEQRAAGHYGPVTYRPPAMNLATTPSGLDEGALERHLQRHPEDRIFKPLLEGVFAALEQAHILGSLLRPGEHLDEALAAFQKPGTLPLGLDDGDAALRRTLTELAKHDPAELKRLLLDRVAQSFAAEAGSADVSAALFGREAEQGVRLLQLLDRKYAVVATNPPYMGSGSMNSVLRSYIKDNYKPGKRDLYTALILRCQQLSCSRGRLGMVTQQSWMFLGSFEDLRAVPEKDLAKSARTGDFTGLLRETTIEALAHLGPHAFEEIGGEVVQSAMFTLSNRRPSKSHQLVAFRLVGLRSPTEKAEALRKQAAHHIQETSNLLRLPGSPFGYWLSRSFLKVVGSDANIRGGAETRAGLTTGNSLRFYRAHWELFSLDDWLPLANGGSYQKWLGHNVDYLRWGNGWISVLSELGNKLPSIEYYAASGVVLSQSARGCLSCRLSPEQQGFTNSSIAVFPKYPTNILDLAAWLNNRCASYLVRLYSQKMGIEAKHLDGLPLRREKSCRTIAEFCSAVKEYEVNSDPVESTFEHLTLRKDYASAVCARLACEGTLESEVISILKLADLVDEIKQATGTPAGWYPLIANLDSLPNLSDELDLPLIPEVVLEYLAHHERLDPSPDEVDQIKANLRSFYEAGPGASADDLNLDEMDHYADEEENASGAYIPIPTETFLEELSVKLQIHPISVYWLLEELRAEGVRCKPEERRLLEDRLSVLVLRLLGHRWPKQLEGGEPVPPWADADGIIPLTAGTGEPTLADRIRERLRAEEGALGAQRTEALLKELTNRSLDDWLRRDFFKRHVRQFKKRPIAWHLASTPESRQQAPAFECLLYYHACAGDVLARIRTQYVEPLLRGQRKRAEDARRASDDTAAAQSSARIHELEDFAGRLRQVEEAGFACDQLDDLIADESLDRWSGDGFRAPASRDALLHQERAWRVDLNDGVRVNVAPLQHAGLLAADVLTRAQLRDAVPDRARWRADERRWVRAGNLPRCGWMDAGVPESQRWTEREAEREAERAKLEEKRQAVLERLSGEEDA